MLSYKLKQRQSMSNKQIRCLALHEGTCIFEPIIEQSQTDKDVELYDLSNCTIYELSCDSTISFENVELHDFPPSYDRTLHIVWHDPGMVKDR